MKNFLIILLFSNLLFADNFIHLYNAGKYSDAIKKAEKISDTNSSEYADYFLGKMYFQGDQVKKDLFKSVYYLEKSAKKGNKDAQFLLAKMYSNGTFFNQNQKKAFKLIQSLAKQNHPASEYILALYYYNGIQTSVNFKKSFFWARKAAMNKLPEANYLVGKMYYTGLGVIQDEELAISHLKMASLYGNLKAQELLSKILIKKDQKTLKNSYSKETIQAVKVALRNGSVKLWKVWNKLNLGEFDDSKIGEKTKK